MTKRKVKKAIAIVGEGITEWMYFDYIRRNHRYAFSLKPDLPKHSHYSHIFKKAKELIQKGYDIVFCVLDLGQEVVIMTRTMPCQLTFRNISQTMRKVEIISKALGSLVPWRQMENKEEQYNMQYTSWKRLEGILMSQDALSLKYISYFNNWKNANCAR